MKDTVLLEQLSWAEVAELLEGGTTTAIIPSGSIEQHGPHLPVGTDAMEGEALAEMLARRIGHAVVAPVIRPGCSDHHMAFPGTISLPPALFQEVIVTYCRCLAQHGFRRLVLLSAHGGNFAATNAAAAQAAAELAPKGVEIVDLTSDKEGFLRAWTDPLAEFGLQQGTSSIHADLSETSFGVAAWPERVDMARAAEGYNQPGDLSDALSPGGKGIRAVSANGILGDARAASAEIGKRVIASVVDYLYGAYIEAIK